MSSSQPPFPALIAFDLDYTLWDLWIDTHVTGPLRRNAQTHNEVLDRHGKKICLYKDAPAILHRLRGEGVKIAACSRTDAPRMARQALDLLLVPPPKKSSKESTTEAIPAIKFFDQLEIYPGSKITHFKRIHQATGIKYSDMLFFDDEHRNAEVEDKLGVTFYLVPRGLNKDAFEKGLEKWRKRRRELDATEQEQEQSEGS